MLNLLILANENSNDHYLWEKACQKYSSKVKYSTVNLTKSDWLQQIRKQNTDCLIAKPGGLVEKFKQLYDERIQILVESMGYRVFPTLNEILIYENKRYLAYWLDANSIPHPETYVFYNKQEALNFISNTTLPFVAKLNIGASGNGVQVIKTKEQARKYTEEIFSRGIHPSYGPRLDIGNIFKRAIQKFKHPSQLLDKLKIYNQIASNLQIGSCLFQQYIPHNFEWRVVQIGKSFFAHKKIVKNEKASGGLLKQYENPPYSLLNFARELNIKFGFESLAIDVFEIAPNDYLVNEMQCIFGQSDPYQMLVDGRPGRYIYKNSQWIFEEGMFNTNESFDLRIEYLIDTLIK